MGDLTDVHIAIYSDLHGILPETVNCDLAIIAGDVCPEDSIIGQHRWLNRNFSTWIKNFKRAIWVAGNHDYVCDYCPDSITNYSDEHVYLRDSNTTLFPDFHVWGTPWSLPYGRYSFMASEESIARRLNDPAAAHASIVVSHGPPFGYGDLGFGNERAGSVALREFITEKQPPLVIFGHIHEGRGIYECGNSVLINAAMAGNVVGRGLQYGPILVTFSRETQKVKEILSDTSPVECIGSEVRE